MLQLVFQPQCFSLLPPRPDHLLSLNIQEFCVELSQQMGIRIQVGRISLWRPPTATASLPWFQGSGGEALWPNQNAAEYQISHLGQDALAFWFALHHQSFWQMWLQFSSSFKSSWNGTSPLFPPEGTGEKGWGVSRRGPGSSARRNHPRQLLRQQRRLLQPDGNESPF